MWVDGILVIILLVTVAYGYRRGFVHTFLHTIGWILSVVLGFVWYPHVLTFLKEKTGLYDLTYRKISDLVTARADSATDSAMSGIPEVIRSLLDKAVTSATDVIASSMSENLANLLFHIIAFLVVAFAIKIVFFIILSLFSKEKNDGLIGKFDGILGLGAGALKGLILIFILLALLVPITSLSGNTLLMDQLDNSVLGNYLYNNNIILALIKDFL